MDTVAPTRLVRLIQAPLKTNISISGAAAHHTEIGLFFCRMYEGLLRFFKVENKPDLDNDAQISARGFILELITTVASNKQYASSVGFLLDFTFINFHTDDTLRFRLVNVLDSDGVHKIELQTTDSKKITNFEKVPGTILDIFNIAISDPHSTSFV